MRKHRRKKTSSAVELNLAAMLDMAFQLLAFFILTFRPTPIEGYLQLHMPPPVAVTQMQTTPTEGEGTGEWNTLNLFLTSTANGDMASVAVDLRSQTVITGKLTPESLRKLSRQLKAIFDTQQVTFDRVQLSVDGRLRYDELMQIVDVCTKQVLPDGKPMNRVSFIDMSNPGDVQ